MVPMAASRSLSAPGSEVAKVLGISWLVDTSLLCQPLSLFNSLFLLGVQMALSKGYQALPLGPTFTQHDLTLTD